MRLALIPKPLACLILAIAFYGLGIGLTVAFHQVWCCLFAIVALRFIIEITHP